MFEGGSGREMPDELATEEALEIRLLTGGEVRPVAVTMRTPGADRELATGFLFAEGVIRSVDDLVRVEEAPERPGRRGGIVAVELADGLEPDLSPLERHFQTSSACGVCGKANLESLLLARAPKLPAGPRLDPELLHTLPGKLRAAQGVFQTTGGLHAAALFTAAGELVEVREDVGRHNALDKLVGWALADGCLPLHDHLLLVSGRTSYEILQKSLMAEIPVVCAVSAPSSLAVSLARRFGVTLVGFLRDGRFNLYSGIERIRRNPSA